MSDTDIKTIHSFRCDLNVGPCDTELHAHLMHQDALADVFSVAVFRGNETVDLTDVSVVGYLYYGATKQTLPMIGTSSGHFALMTLTSPCYAQPGYASLVIQLQKDDVRHTVLKVNFCIDRTGSDKVIDPGEELPTLAELLGRLDELERLTTEAEEAADAANAAREDIQGDLAAVKDELGAQIDKLGVFTVTTTYDEEGRVYADKTPDEIRAAVEAGYKCFLRNVDGRVFSYEGDMYCSEAKETCPTFAGSAEYRTGDCIVFARRQVTSTKCVYGLSSAFPLPTGPDMHLVSNEYGYPVWEDITPAPVVILPETEMTLDGGYGTITTPLQAPVAVGDVAQITYNGTAYECTGVAGEGIMFGNFELIGMTGGNPDAPFVIALMYDGVEQDDGTMQYGVAIVSDDSTTATISIVVTGSDANSGNDGGGVFTARFNASSALAAMELSDCDKSMFEFDAAYRAGKDIRIVAAVGETQEYIGRVVCASKPEGDAWVIFNAVVPFGTGSVTNTFTIAPGDGGVMTATKTGSN